jgi:hypothetical protein
MKKLVFLFFISSQIYSQKVQFKGKLLDKNTSKPIAYANISFLKTNLGISSQVNGVFNLEIDKKLLQETVHISCLNYKDTIVFAKQLQNKNLFLQPIDIVLNEVILLKRIEKIIVLGEVKKKISGVHTSGMRMIAKYFPKDKRSECCIYLETLEIYFAKKLSHRKKSKFRIRVFDKDTKTGLPKNDILNTSLELEIKDGQKKVTIDISGYNLEMPENGLFIAFEKLFIPYNEYNSNDVETKSKVYYSPLIGFTKYNKKDLSSNLYLYTKGVWKLSQLSKIDEMSKYAPAISLTLSN